MVPLNTMNRASSSVRKAVIPVAGLGTRFLPATKAIPKEMIPIIDIPMIQLIVEEAVKSGIEEVILVTSKYKKAIENHFSPHPELEETLERTGKSELLAVVRGLSKMCNLKTVTQDKALGLGHAVLQAASAVGNEPFAVLLGDDLIDSPRVACTKQLIDIYEQEKCSVVGVMEVPKEEVSKYGMVGGKMKNPRLMDVDRLVEKPAPKDAPSQLAIPGRYILDPEIFNCLRETKPAKNGEIQLTDGLQLLAKRKGLRAYLFEGTRYDSGDRIGFIDATIAYALKRPELREEVKALLEKHLR
jgi:UTP--glucose-1-phosphate uridylyltransferase